MGDKIKQWILNLLLIIEFEEVKKAAEEATKEAVKNINNTFTQRKFIEANARYQLFKKLLGKIK